MKRKIAVVGSSGLVGSQVVRHLKKNGHDVTEIEIGTNTKIYNKKDLEVFVVCVSTPAGPDGNLNLEAIRKVCLHIPAKALVIIKSTVPPSFCQYLRSIGTKFVIAPEFLDADNAEHDFDVPHRNVYGSDLVENNDEANILFPHARNTFYMQPEGACIVKLAANSFFGMKNVFFNGLADLCFQQGLKFVGIIEAVASDPRIGRVHTEVFHKGGRGAGGTCIPKDFAQYDVLYEKIVGGNDFTSLMLRSANAANAERLRNSRKATNIGRRVRIEWKDTTTNEPEVTMY